MAAEEVQPAKVNDGALVRSHHPIHPHPLGMDRFGISFARKRRRTKKTFYMYTGPKYAHTVVS